MPINTKSILAVAAILVAIILFATYLADGSDHGKGSEGDTGYPAWIDMGISDYSFERQPSTWSNALDNIYVKEFPLGTSTDDVLNDFRNEVGDITGLNTRFAGFSYDWYEVTMDGLTIEATWYDD